LFWLPQIGRAGRLGAPGWAITFVNNENKSVFAELVDILEPLEVQLPSQLLHSPHLSLQRERRKRKQQIWGSSSDSGATKKTKEERSFYDRLADVQLCRTEAQAELKLKSQKYSQNASCWYAMGSRHAEALGQNCSSDNQLTFNA